MAGESSREPSAVSWRPLREFIRAFFLSIYCASRSVLCSPNPCSSYGTQVTQADCDSLRAAHAAGSTDLHWPLFQYRNDNGASAMGTPVYRGTFDAHETLHVYVYMWGLELVYI